MSPRSWISAPSIPDMSSSSPGYMHPTSPTFRPVSAVNCLKLACAWPPPFAAVVFLADGAAAMQEVFHAHLHVIPRYAEDGFGLVFADHYYRETPRADLEAACQRIVAVWD